MTRLRHRRHGGPALRLGAYDTSRSRSRSKHLLHTCPYRIRMGRMRGELDFYRKVSTGTPSMKAR